MKNKQKTNLLLRLFKVTLLIIAIIFIMAIAGVLTLSLEITVVLVFAAIAFVLTADYYSCLPD